MPGDERSADHRRINKPIMEKRRRARINDSLTQLKSLVLEGLKKDPARHSKLEKADILEMAVKHLRSLQARPERAASRYRDGYVECRREVAAYLGQDTALDGALKQRLLSHLSAAVGGGGQVGGTVPAISASLGSLQLLPAALSAGQIAFLLPGGLAGPLPGAVPAAVSGAAPGAGTEPTPAPQRPLSVCTEPAAASLSSVASSSSVGSASPAPSWDPAEPRSPASPSSSEGSFGSCDGRADSPRPLDLVAHNRCPDEDAHWRPW